MTSAIEYWKSRVEAHHAQSIRAQKESDWESGDFWSSLASSFREGPHRTDDLVLNRLIQEVGPNSTVLDVGGGAGRYSLPLALRCGQVTVVDSSESMLAELRDGASAANIDDLGIVQGLWEDASVEAADLVLCAHVIYGIVEIEQFIRKLERHASERVLMLAFSESPLSFSNSRVPGSGVRGRGSGERETTASSLAGKEESSRKEDNSGQGKDGPAGAIAQGGNGR